MNRRQFLQLSAAGAASLALPKRSRAADRPNILFIAIDDLNDWIGCLGGHPDTITPNLDRLASRGTLFTNAHCAAPACNPSRTALLTGYLPCRSGVYHNDQPWRPVLPEAVTLGQYLMQHGYEVKGAGKIFHGGFNDLPSWGEYFKQPGDPMPPNRPLNGIPKTAHFDWGPVDMPDEAMADYQVTEWVNARLKSDRPEPFFLACGLFRPHLPWFVPRQYFDKFPVDQVTLPHIDEHDLDDVPEAGRKIARPEGDHRKVIESHNWSRAVQGYLASINFADTMLGRVLDAFESSPYRDNTAVVLWSDHGWHLGEKLHWRKFSLWEEATQNALMIAAPGAGSAGQTCARPASLLDIYPTVLELCGLPPKDDNDGHSLVPLLQDPQATWDRPALTTHGRGNHSLRDERWRYTRYRDGSEELYDHEADELEWRNLAGTPEHAEVQARLKAHLPTLDAEDAPKQKKPNRDPGKD